MIQIAYISSSIQPMATDALLTLLQQCLTNNLRQAITGMLMYGNGTFLQVLEGDEKSVAALVDKIGKDSRHSGIAILHRKSIERREYRDWSMAFKRVSEEALQHIEGLHDFGAHDFNIDYLRVNTSVVEKLMNHFRAPHWDPLIRELDAKEKVIEHLSKVLAQARGRIDIASLVLESVVNASRAGDLNENHIRLYESALDSLRSVRP